MNKSDNAGPVTIDQAGLDILLRWFQKLAAIRGPYFTWWVIDLCERNKIPFPDWVNAYLGQCARRMGSDQAKQAPLQEIFGFPKKKPGPGGLFDQDREVIREGVWTLWTLTWTLRSGPWTLIWTQVDPWPQTQVAEIPIQPHRAKSQMKSVKAQKLKVALRTKSIAYSP
jgi:hypothetical protein